MEASTPGSTRWFIIDAPITSETKDAFGHVDVAENLHRMVTEQSGNRRMIGLFGAFGVGKSTVLRLLEEKLRGHRPALRLIRMSAERHEPVGFHRAAVYAFAEALVEAGEVEAADAESILLPLRVAQTSTASDFRSSAGYRAFEMLGALVRKSRRKIIARTSASFAAALAIGALIFFLIPATAWAEFGAFITAGLTAIGAIAPVAWFTGQVKTLFSSSGALLNPGSTAVQYSRVESADEQERTFAALAKKAKSNLVVAVDDIDRLSQDQILDALNAIRSFQLTCPAKERPIFIVSLDENIVRDAIGDSGATRLSEGSEQEFLNRLFTLRQEMPIHERTDLRDYALQLLKTEAGAAYSHLGSLAEDVVSVLIYEGVRNPRHAIRLLNAFIGDLRLALGRENRPGTRSLAVGVVSQKPQVLARITVLRADFPAFFAAIVRDASLLQAGSRALGSTDMDDADAARLRASGFDPSNPAHRPLFTYLSRTAGWVPNVEDIVPFLYLGQDRFGRTLGNRQAADLRTAMANNLSSDLVRAATSIGEGNDGRRYFQELVVNVLRDLSGLERNNGISAVIEAAGQEEVFATSEIADTVATMPGISAESANAVTGLVRLMNVSPPATARQLARATLKSTADNDAATIWKYRDDLESSAGADQFSEWAKRRIAEIDTELDAHLWASFETGSALSFDLVQRLTQLVAGGLIDINDELADDLLALRTRIESRGTIGEASTKAIETLIALTPDRLEAVVGMIATSVSQLTAKQLANFIGVVHDASEKLEEGALADARSVPLLLELVVRTATDAGAWGRGKDAARVSSASLGLNVIASWAMDGLAQPSDVATALRVMLDEGVDGHSAAVESLFDAWMGDPDGVDQAGESKLSTLKTVVSRISELDAPAAASLKARISASLLHESQREPLTRVLPGFLTHSSTASWPDDFVNEMLQAASHSSAETPGLLGAMAVLVNESSVSANVQVLIADKIQSLLRQSTSRPWALDAARSFDWDPSALERVAIAYSPYVGSLEENAFWNLFDQQVSAENVEESFKSRATELAEMAVSGAVKRVNYLTPLLPYETATSLALKANSETAFMSIISRLESPEQFLQAILLAANSGEHDSAAKLVRSMAEASFSSYGQAIELMTNETFDLPTTAHDAAWTFSTVPLTVEARTELWQRVRTELHSGAAEARRATRVLVATAHDSALDEIVGADIAEVMWHWIAIVPDEAVAGDIAASLRESDKARSTALSRWRRKPKRPDRIRAYQAAVAAFKEA